MSHIKLYAECNRTGFQIHLLALNSVSAGFVSCLFLDVFKKTCWLVSAWHQLPNPERTSLTVQKSRSCEMYWFVSQFIQSIFRGHVGEDALTVKIQNGCWVPKGLTVWKPSLWSMAWQVFSVKFAALLRLMSDTVHAPCGVVTSLCKLSSVFRVSLVTIAPVWLW